MNHRNYDGQRFLLLTTEYVEISVSLKLCERLNGLLVLDGGTGKESLPNSQKLVQHKKAKIE